MTRAASRQRFENGMEEVIRAAIHHRTPKVAVAPGLSRAEQVSILILRRGGIATLNKPSATCSWAA